MQRTSLTQHEELNGLIYRTLFYVNLYRSYKLSKNSLGFWPTLYFGSLLLQSALTFVIGCKMLQCFARDGIIYTVVLSVLCSMF